VRSTLTLGFVFFALAGLARYAGGPHLSPLTWTLMAMLVIAGVLVILGLRAGFYVGLFTGAITALAGLIAWAGIGGTALALPIHPALAIVVGLYLCMRVATTKVTRPMPRHADEREEEPVR
jgi:hypothetical protein